MRWAITAATFGMTVLALGVANAQEDEIPTGEYTLTPAQGPVGTVVHVEGSFDRDITSVRFQCIFRDTSDEGLETAFRPEQPSPTITFEYTIPETLGLRQRGGEVRSVLGGECAFYAEGSHRLLAFEMPFTVTRGALPDTGTGLEAGSDARREIGLAAAAAAAGGLLIAVAWRWRRAA